MPSNNIAFARNYTSVIDEVYQRASVSGVLNSGRRMVRAGHNAKETLIPKISVTGLGDYTRNVGYKTGAITYEFETKTFNYDRGIRLFADVMDVEEAGVNDCFVEAGAELQRTQVAPEVDAFTFAQIAGHTGVTTVTERYASADAEDILEDLRTVTSAMDENQVTLGSHPVHHAHAQGRPGRLLLREPEPLQPHARALLAHRGGAAGALLHGHRPALRRR